jgi:3-deoxy-7-phosphoheptulonate synthase
MVTHAQRVLGKGVPAFLLNCSPAFANLRALDVADRWSFGDPASMVIVMKKGSGREDLARVVRAVEDLGCQSQVVPGADRTVIVVSGSPGPLDPDAFERLSGVARAVPTSAPYKLAARESKPDDTVIRVGSGTVGGGGLFVIAGPCAVETGDQIVETARLMKRAGADALRGGAYKPRSSPYSFQGLGKEGLRLLIKAREASGLPIVTEAVDEASLDLVEEHADIIQIGARNMQNYELLKRGMSATLEDLLLSAEYVLSHGNPHVILCERGIRTFSRHSRYTLDLSVIPAARDLTHLPIVVDPSHSTGRSDRVAAMARAAAAAGADGVMLEVHPAPDEALSDGRQALLPHQGADVIAQLRAISAIVTRKAEAVR